MTCNACNSYFLTNTKKPNKQADMAEKSRLNISLSIIKTFIFYTLDSVFNLPKYFAFFRLSVLFLGHVYH